MGYIDILRSSAIQNFKGTDAELFKAVKAAAKAQVGHGISAEYFNKQFGFKGVATAKTIRAAVRNAKFGRGGFSKANMQKGLKIYWAKKNAEKEVLAADESQ